jgi:hypothetical protein
LRKRSDGSSRSAVGYATASVPKASALYYAFTEWRRPGGQRFYFGIGLKGEEVA